MMVTDKTQELLSLLLQTKDDLEMRGDYLEHQMDNINKAISIAHKDNYKNLQENMDVLDSILVAAGKI